MSLKECSVDPYIGITINGYSLVAEVGQGRIGSVYKAVRTNPKDTLACKVIPKIRDGWIREIEKVVRLRGVPQIVQYHAHGSELDKYNQQFVWILWDFIDGINLRQYMDDRPWPLDIAFVESIAKAILNVLLACRAEDIHHGDLHPGNILIKNPDPRLRGMKRTIWISDFGYGGSHIKKKPKDDYRQLFAIVSSLLRIIDPSALNPRDKILHQKINEFLKKKILESDPTQKVYVGNTELLLNDFDQLALEAELESSAATKGGAIKGTGDYLMAETIGNRFEEWKSLFVPEFLAAQDLLSKNITVLTGARGCGKTMVFRRMTAFMDKSIGESSGVKGADQFVGFYLNCRDLAEAFPWLPRKLNEGMTQQITHFFHLAWFSEICKALALHKADRQESFEWLDAFLLDIFYEKYHPLPLGADSLAHTRAFIEQEKEKSRISPLGKIKGFKNWPLARPDFLDVLQVQLEHHIPWIGEKPLYLFLDDYTIPIVTREVQLTLNPIVFNRRSKLFFKISSESSNSFDRRGLRGKPLELHQDFELIDLATESLHQDNEDKTKLLESIFKPRIARHEPFREEKFCLSDVLGKTSLSNNALAKLMRDIVQKNDNIKTDTTQRILYHGLDVFAGMWTSDTRTMIQMFTEILRDANGTIKKGEVPIPEYIQDKIYRTTGGELLKLMGAVVDPELCERGPSSTRPGEKYGTHLKDIVEAFVKVSRYELTEGALVKNEGRLNPKQAFRLEVIDKFDLSDEAEKYFEGLIRWHIFLQDWRGKSMRGMITPRLYLNRILIPFCKLSFSSHDHIHLTNEEFINLLVSPDQFPNYWKKKRKSKGGTGGRQRTLW